MQRQWREIQQILQDNATHQEATRDAHASDVNNTARMKQLFAHAHTDMEGSEQQTSEEDKGGGRGVMNAEDEFVVNQVLKNKLYDNMPPPPQAEDLVSTLRGTSGRTGGGSGSNQHLRYPQNTYTRGSSSGGRVEARSIRRPQGEKGWK